MDGDHRGPEGGRGGGAAHQEEEAEDARDELEEEHGHGGQAQPAVDAVEVGDGLVLEGVVIPGSHEPDHDAGDGQKVEHRVQQLAPHPSAAPAGAVHQHTWTNLRIICT